MSEEKNLPEGETGKQGIAGLFSGFAVYLVSMIVIPAVLVFTLLFFLLTNSSFYVGILENIDILHSFVTARNFQVEAELKNEIEKEVHLEEFRQKYEKIKKNYEDKKKAYYFKNRTDEYRSLKKKRESLDDLDFERAPDTYKTKADFENYRERELTLLDTQISEIEKYRDKNEDEIEKYEDAYDDARDEFEDASETLEDREEDAKDIIRDKKGSFTGRVMDDIEKLAPVLTRDLNSKFIEGPVKNEIERLIRFCTSYDDAVKNRAVKFNRFGAVESLRLPDISLSLLVTSEVNGVAQKRHLLGQVFADRIRDMDGLKEKRRLLDLFTFTESGFAEMIGRSYLKDASLTISDGIIRVRKIKLEGETARKAALFMNILSEVRKYLYYIPLIALLFFLLTVITAGKGRKIKRAGSVLFLPSLILVLPALVLVMISYNATGIYRRFFSDLVLDVGAKAGSVIGVHLFVPVTLLLIVMLIFGFILRRIARRMSDDTAGK